MMPRLLPLLLLGVQTTSAAFCTAPFLVDNLKSATSLHAFNKDEQNAASSRRSFIKTTATTMASIGTSILLPNISPASAASEVDSTSPKVGGAIAYGSDKLMENKAHGSTSEPVQEGLRYGVSRKLADRICSYNRMFAEMGGYFRDTSFEKVVMNADGPVTFYDSVSGKPLFVAPIGRSPEQFVQESRVHGWPSFRDSEVVWENVRVLRSSGETVSVDGTHLGHNLPDRSGNRYCINLVSIAGNPTAA